MIYDKNVLGPHKHVPVPARVIPNSFKATLFQIADIRGIISSEYDFDLFKGWFILIIKILVRIAIIVYISHCAVLVTRIYWPAEKGDFDSLLL